MLYGIQRLAELNPKSSGTREIGGELPPHGWNRREQGDNRGASAQVGRTRSASPQPGPVLKCSLLVQGPRALKRARVWQHVAGILRCCHQERCFRGQTQTEARASLQVIRRGWKEMSVVMHKASVLEVWERGRERPFFLRYIALLACFLPAETHPLSQKVLLLFVWGRAVNHIPGRGRVPGFDWIPNQTGPIILFVSYSNMLESL